MRNRDEIGRTVTKNCFIFTRRRVAVYSTVWVLRLGRLEAATMGLFNEAAGDEPGCCEPIITLLIDISYHRKNRG